MKKTTLLFVIIIATISAFAQTPDSFKYQTIVRDISGDIILITGYVLSVIECTMQPEGIHLITS